MTQISEKSKELEQFDFHNDDYEMTHFQTIEQSSDRPIYKGSLLLREIALFASVHVKQQRLFLLIPIIRCLLPFIVRAVDRDSWNF